MEPEMVDDLDMSDEPEQDMDSAQSEMEDIAGVEDDLQKRILDFKQDDAELEQKITSLRDQIDNLEQMFYGDEQPSGDAMIMIVPEQVNVSQGPELAMASKKIAGTHASFGLNGRQIGYVSMDGNPEAVLADLGDPSTPEEFASAVQELISSRYGDDQEETDAPFEPAEFGYEFKDGHIVIYDDGKAQTAQEWEAAQGEEYSKKKDRESARAAYMKAYMPARQAFIKVYPRWRSLLRKNQTPEAQQLLTQLGQFYRNLNNISGRTASGSDFETVLTAASGLGLPVTTLQPLVEQLKAAEPSPGGRSASTKTAAFNIEWFGEWNNIEVNLTDTDLSYESYEEGKAEGYHFTMKKDGEEWVVVNDESSTPVPGSHILWLYANGHKGWDEAGEAGNNLTTESIRIPADKMEAAVRSMAEEEKADLEKSEKEDATEASKKTAADNPFESTDKDSKGNVIGEGDKVRVLKSKRFPQYVGQVGTIVGGYADEGKTLITMADGMDIEVKLKNVELVNDPVSAKKTADTETPEERQKRLDEQHKLQYGDWREKHAPQELISSPKPEVEPRMGMIAKCADLKEDVAHLIMNNEDSEKMFGEGVDNYPDDVAPDAVPHVTLTPHSQVDEGDEHFDYYEVQFTVPGEQNTYRGSGDIEVVNGKEIRSFGFTIDDAEPKKMGMIEKRIALYKRAGAIMIRKGADVSKLHHALKTAETKPAQAPAALRFAKRVLDNFLEQQLPAKAASWKQLAASLKIADSTEQELQRLKQLIDQIQGSLFNGDAAAITQNLQELQQKAQELQQQFGKFSKRLLAGDGNQPTDPLLANIVNTLRAAGDADMVRQLLRAQTNKPALKDILGDIMLGNPDDSDSYLAIPGLLGKVRAYLATLG